MDISGNTSNLPGNAYGNPMSAVVTLLCFCLPGWYLYKGARNAAQH